jgi:uncharacterized protein YacL
MAMPEQDAMTRPRGGQSSPNGGAGRRIPAETESGQRLLLMVVRLLFMVLLVSVTLLAAAAKSEEGTPEEFEWSTAAGLLVASFAVGIIVLLVDVMTPNKRLTSMVGVYMGVCAGLIGALAVGALLDVVAEAWDINTGRFETYFGLAKVVIAIVLCYLAVSVVLTTKDNFRLVIPYVEFAKQVRGVRPLLLDTSALIDGRIQLLAQSGFLDAPLVVPQFVVDELQTLSDSGDKLKRERGRRGLDMVRSLQESAVADITVDPADTPGRSVDHKLLVLAEEQNLRILTTDHNGRAESQRAGEYASPASRPRRFGPGGDLQARGRTAAGRRLSPRRHHGGHRGSRRTHRRDPPCPRHELPPDECRTHDLRPPHRGGRRVGGGRRADGPGRHRPGPSQPAAPTAGGAIAAQSAPLAARE